MFPIGDDNSDVRTVPVVTYCLLAINILVFLVELNAGESFIRQWAFVPSRFSRRPCQQHPDYIHGHVHAWQLDAPASATCFISGYSAITSKIG